MRVSLALIPIVAAFVSYVNAYSDPSFNAREYIDELAGREDAYTEALERREIMSDISTRELVQELSERLERRGEKLMQCKYCKRTYRGTRIPVSWDKNCDKRTPGKYPHVVETADSQVV
ncbi:ectomycorrhizas-regulated small secreted protein [Ephemerocybe angulata]|uniref:Ectomycorrhizas-regulated small secreted protein n=1 Tax=Ephemerocybe angulata TaxID=980116 RepID=A0A8H6IG68_9AGAR|nr:ectomycorrhizas-regulated small secreted protein [Tulosesus angulatus]